MFVGFSMNVHFDIAADRTGLAYNIIVLLSCVISVADGRKHVLVPQAYQHSR
jgi:predicted RNase H-related nuclease YkuK (DUF458 family)